MPDAIDLQLLNALQVNPRISWARLAEIVGVDPSALSRRWSALVDGGIVWSSCFPSFETTQQRLQMIALVEVQVKPGRRERVITQLAAMPEVISIHCTSGDRDLYLTLAGADVDGIDRFVDERVAPVPGITRTLTNYVRRTIQAGSDWRFSALTANQVLAVEDTRPLSRRAATFNSAYLRVIEAMKSDVRRSVTSIHEEVGRSLTSVSRSIDAIMSNEWAAFRIDCAQKVFGWGVSAMMWLRVPSPEVEKVGAAFSFIPQARFCASVAGPANIAVTFWLRDLNELEEIETKLTQVFRSVEVVDRWIVPRTAKRSGHVLDRDGRHSHFVPVDFRSSLDGH